MPAGVGSLPGVNLLVASQRSRSREALVADATAVRFYPCVPSHVRLHVLETLSADVAGSVRLSVRLQVSQQTVG